MATGLLAWTCLLLAAGTPGDACPITHLKERGFQIPIRIEPGHKNEVAELILYVSRNQGQNWEIADRKPPDQKTFDFKASADGLLFFNIAVTDRTGRQNPPDMYKAPVCQKIMIDTTKPVVRIATADLVGDTIQVNWEIQEEHADWATLKLEYRAANSPGSQWTPLPIQRGEHGNVPFRPVVSGDVVVRLSLRDLAGNEGVDERTVAAGSAAVVSNNNQAGLIRTGGNEVIPPPAPTPATTPMPATTPTPPSLSEGAAIGRSTDPAPAPAQAPFSATPAPTPAATRGALPTLQIVNKEQVTLGYDVSKVGPSGLGNVEVYLTTDGGMSWEQMPAKDVMTQPIVPEPGKAPQKGKVTIKLPKQGQEYGFYLVVKSRAGLGKPGPRAGDAPQVRVEADTIRPNADLYLPQADSTRSDALVLSWKAEDRNLESNPVTLEWSENGRDWNPIGDGRLPNSGRYTWTVPANVPPKVHLKLTVRDLAGNVSVAKTDVPVLVDLSRPEIGEVSVIK